MNDKQNSGVLAAGLALFSMFFGAGDLLWPLILGGSSGDQNFFAMLGLLITGVSLPLLGLIAMMLFQGDYHGFFGRIGKWPSIALILVVQLILGPVGSIPRVITLSFATLKPYLPEVISLASFSVLCCLVILAFTLKPRKLVQLLGLVLTPVLLLCLGAILLLGFISHPEPQSMNLTSSEAFVSGIKVGYNTLDLIASFIFAPLVLSHFIMEGERFDTQEGKFRIFRKMVKASLIAAGLLCTMYIGLTYVASYYTPVLGADVRPEERLSAISLYLLGPYGASIASIAVVLACLTTGIPLVSIFAKYLKKDLLKDRGGDLVPLLITLTISCLIANLGFMGIAKMLGPVLQILCPGLIMLSVLNIFHKLFETRVPKVPVFVTFALSTLSHVF
jgi:branched-chain amino acid:cation transporter, LIVCS family